MMSTSRTTMPNLIVICLLLIAVHLTWSLKNHPSSDSILDIINTKEVERLMAERNENKLRDEGKRYLIENDLTENHIIMPSEHHFGGDAIQNVKLLDGEAEFLSRTENPRIDIDVLLRRNSWNDSLSSSTNTDLLSDLRGFNGRKLLKSSKNALFVTRKEYLQRDWCKTEPLVQKIKEEGCLTRTVINRFCYGQCNSFYIPKNPKRRMSSRTGNDDETDDRDQNGPAFKSCAFCRPYKFTWITVTLRCPSMVPAYRKKRIQRIKQCKCVAVNM